MSDRSPSLPARVLRWLWRLPRHLLTGLVKAYRAVIGPHLPPSCRFTPTCSEYAIQALREYGAVKGLILTIWRLLRCHPLGGEGYDPPRWFGEDERPADRGRDKNSLPDTDVNGSSR